MLVPVERVLRAPGSARALVVVEAASIAAVVGGLVAAALGASWVAVGLVAGAALLDAVPAAGRAGRLRLLYHVRHRRWQLLLARLTALAVVAGISPAGSPGLAVVVAGLLVVAAVSRITIDWNVAHIKAAAGAIGDEAAPGDVTVLSGLLVGSTSPGLTASRSGEVERELKDLVARFRWRERGRFDLSLRVAEAVALVAVATVFAGAPPALAGGLLVVGAIPLVALAIASFRARVTAGTAVREAGELLTSFESRYRDAVVEALHRRDPAYVVYLYAFDDSYYTLYEWVDLLAAASERGVVIVVGRNPPPPPRPVPLPVVHASGSLAAVDCLAPSTRVAFYLTDSVRNVDFIRRSTISNGLRHVFLNHGDSDKPINASPTMRLFDEIWVAGQMAVDRFERHGVRMDPRAFRLIGRPQTAHLQDRGPVSPGADGRPLHVLYAPTWESFSDAENFSSLRALGESLVASLLAADRDVKMIVRPHPATGSQDRRYAEVLDRLRARLESHVGSGVDGTTDLHEQLEWSDLLVADISAVATEYLATGRPLVMCNPKRLPPDELARRYPTTGAAYLVEDGTDLVGLLNTIVTTDPLRDERLAVGSYAFQLTGDASVEAFRKAVVEVSGA